MQVMKLAARFLFSFVALLSACGGGGGSNERTLQVDFAYPTSQALFWRNSVLDIQSIGLEGNSPRCAVTRGALPAGLLMDAQTCRISGVPTQVGTASAAIRLTVPGFTGQVEKEFVFEVVGPALSYAFPLTNRRGTPISARPSAVAPWSLAAGETLSYAVASGSLPPGLRVEPATGEVHGILTESAQSSFVIATDVTGALGAVSIPSQTYTMTTVLEGLLFFYGPNDLPVRAGQGAPLSLQPLFNFGFYLSPSNYSFGEYRLATTSPPMPSGLALNPATGEISGVPTVAGAYELTFEVNLMVMGQAAMYPSKKLELTIEVQ
jgi:large repetitive protein